MKRTLVILAHIGVWLSLFLLLSPKPLGIFNLQLIEPLTAWEHSVFLLYGFALSAVMFYSFAQYRLPVFVRNRNPNQFLRANLVYLLGFSLGETIIDCIFYFGLYPPSPSFLFDSSAFSWEIFNAFHPFLLLNIIVTFAILVAANAYGFSKHWFQDQKLKSKLRHEKLKAELVALKHQINPHFLFNTLNSLYSTALDNEDEPTAEGIAKLSSMMRYMLYEANDEQVSLKKELDYIGQYIDLQKMRLNKDIDVKFNILGDAKGRSIPPMILQPFVENAFKYGISQIHPSYIKVESYVDDKNFHFSVTNSKHPQQAARNTKFKGIGLKNVKQRLELICKDCYELHIEEDEKRFHIELFLERGELEA